MARLHDQNMKPGRPAKPPGLSPNAIKEWDRLVAELEESDIAIARAHGRLVEQAAEIAVDLADAKDTVAIEGAYVTNDKTGVMQLHPAARRMDSLRRDYIKVLSLLGLRSAVGGTPKSASKSLEDLLDGDD
jgi:P27 family predicted phage terminase small subunit